MADYKFANKEGTSVLRYADNFFVSEGGKDWDVYLDYVNSGGETDPFMTVEEWRQANSETARIMQDYILEKLSQNNDLKQKNLAPIMSTQMEREYENLAQLLQGDIDLPSDSEEYSPPLPPDTTSPVYTVLTCTITREPGWNDVLGFRFVIAKIDDNTWSPGILSMGVYSNPECDGYLYTTGAFSWDAEKEEWYAQCPAGQEPGDADVHFGLLESGQSVMCFTLKQGIQKQVFNYYAEK